MTTPGRAVAAPTLAAVGDAGQDLVGAHDLICSQDLVGAEDLVAAAVVVSHALISLSATGLEPAAVGIRWVALRSGSASRTYPRRRAIARSASSVRFEPPSA